MRAVGVSHRRALAVITFASVATMLVLAMPVPAGSAGAVPTPATSVPSSDATLSAASPTPTASPTPHAGAADSSAPLAAASPVAEKTPEAAPGPADSKETKLPGRDYSGSALEPGRAPATTRIIPPAARVPGPGPSYYPSAPVATPSPLDAGYEAQGSASNQIASYEQHQYLGLNQQGFATRGQLVGGGRESSSIGVVVSQARMPLPDGRTAQGLLILDVKKGSPAAKAGLKGYHQTVQSVLTGATVVAAMVFPPAILALPVIDYTGVGQSYEIIIGVDGIRVTNFMDFDDQVSKAKPGEIVYLSVIRNGARVQIIVPIPLATQTPTR